MAETEVFRIVSYENNSFFYAYKKRTVLRLQSGSLAICFILLQRVFYCFVQP